MKFGDTWIEDTFAEAFRMRYVRVVITAVDPSWAEIAGRAVAGYATSVIGCDAEAGIETTVAPHSAPDGRPGVAVLLFGFSVEALAKAAANRIGQCAMTCATTAVYDGLAGTGDRIALGKHLRFFGDGFQKSKQIDGRRYWRIPVMDGEFLVEESIGVAKGVAGGNIILQAIDATSGLSAARRRRRSGRAAGGRCTLSRGSGPQRSKVGSRYRQLVASTADSCCPTLRGRTQTRLHPEANCAYEIVIDGVDENAVGQAMADAVRAAAGAGVVQIGAGNYGGKLGKFHLHLHQLLK